MHQGPTYRYKYGNFNDDILNIRDRLVLDDNLTKNLKDISSKKSKNYSQFHLNYQNTHTGSNSTTKTWVQYKPNIFNSGYSTKTNLKPIKHTSMPLLSSSSTGKIFNIPPCLSKSNLSYKNITKNNYNKKYSVISQENKQYFGKLYSIKNKFNNESNLINTSHRSLNRSSSGKSVASANSSRSSKMNMSSSEFREVKKVNEMMISKIATVKSPLNKIRLFKISNENSKIADRLKRVKPLTQVNKKVGNLKMLLSPINQQKFNIKLDKIY
jgi:hypothetical protein